MALSEKRRGEIALAVLKYRLKNEGLQLKDLRRSLGNVTQATTISFDELAEFVKEIIAAVTAESLGGSPPLTYVRAQTKGEALRSLTGVDTD